MKPTNNPVQINRQTIQFLKELAANNHRDWFQANKANYIAAQENVISFIDHLIPEMNKHDMLETTSGKDCLLRIYRDIRFSNDKTPYNPRFAFSLKRAGKERRGGYYMHIQPGESVLVCGFYSPEPKDLKRIRQDIEVNFTDWKRLLKRKEIQANFGELRGDQLTTAPKGFPKDHPGIDLLRYKQFYLMHRFADKEILDPNFLREVSQLFKSARPFLDYMSEVLTTDINGVSML